MGLKSNDWCLYEKKEGRFRHRHTEGRKPCDTEDKRLQGCSYKPRNAGSHEMLSEPRKDTPLEPSEEAWPW